MFKHTFSIKIRKVSGVYLSPTLLRLSRLGPTGDVNKNHKKQIFITAKK